MKNMKELIQDTFLELSKSKNFNEISIRLIVKEAHINRSTFYYYYDSIDFLVKDLKRKLENEISDILPLLSHLIDSPITKNSIKPINLFFQKNRELLSLFLIKNIDSTFENDLYNMFSKNLLQSIDGLNLNEFETKLRINYLFQAQLWLWKTWLLQLDNINLCSLLSIVQDIITNGIIKNDNLS